MVNYPKIWVLHTTQGGKTMFNFEKYLDDILVW